MKTQMRFQKVLMVVTLVIAALCFVYSLAFLTGGLGNVRYYITSTGDIRTDYINAANFYDASQAYVGTSVVLSIVLIVLCALMFLFGCNKRRNYYITNYIIIIAVAVMAVVVAIYSFVCISNIMNLFYNDIAWTASKSDIANYFYESEIGTITRLRNNYPVDKSPLSFVLGYILYSLVFVDVAALVLNLIWKIKLMKGEKALLQNGLEMEVA